MKRNRKAEIRFLIALSVLLMSAASVAGVLWTPELSRMQRDIQQQMPGVEFEREFGISLGPLTIGVARTFTRMIPDARQASGYLKDVRNVKVAVYNVRHLRDVKSVKTPRHLQELKSEGWEMAVRVRDDSEMVWVMYKMDDEEIKDLLVVVLEDEELVIVKASGRLERLLARALSESNDVPGVPNFRQELRDELDAEFSTTG